MISLLTTARKATAGALIAFLTPLAALFASHQAITWRVIVACLLSGALAGLTVYQTSNDEAAPVRSLARHAARKDG